MPIEMVATFDYSVHLDLKLSNHSVIILMNFDQIQFDKINLYHIRVNRNTSNNCKETKQENNNHQITISDSLARSHSSYNS